MIAVGKYESANKNEWDNFVRTARNSHFMFERAYMEYHANHFTDYSLLVRQGQTLVALLPAHSRVLENGERQVCSHFGLSFGGLIVSSDMRQALMTAILKTLVSHLGAAGFQKLIYRSMPHVYSSYPVEDDLWSLHQLGARVCEVKATAVMRVGESAAPSDTFSRKLKVAESAGVIVDWSDDVEMFHRSLSEWLESRHDAAPVHSAAELRLLRDRFPNQIVILAASRNGQMLGGNLFFKTGNCVRLQYASNTVEGLSLGVAQAILAKLFSTLIPGTWIELGTSMMPSGELQASLHAFKEFSGARTLLQRSYELTL